MKSNTETAALAFLQARGLIDAKTARALLGEECLTLDPDVWLAELGLEAESELALALQSRRMQAALDFYHARLVRAESPVPDILSDLPPVSLLWQEESEPPDVQTILADYVFCREHLQDEACVAAVLEETQQLVPQDAALLPLLLEQLRDVLGPDLHQRLLALFVPLQQPSFATGNVRQDIPALKSFCVNMLRMEAQQLLDAEFSSAEEAIVEVMLACRFGCPHTMWREFLSDALQQGHPALAWSTAQQLAYLWLAVSVQEERDDLALDALAACSHLDVQASTWQDFSARMSARLSLEAQRALRAYERDQVTEKNDEQDLETAEAVACEPELSAAEPETLQSKEDEDVSASVRSSVDWLAHLRQFFDEHWVIIVGALMILCGASLLAYFTWDKHWLVRYTLLPALLAALTAGIAHLGSWLGRRDEGLLGTQTILIGLAVAMLPLNTMVPALMALDPSVTLRPVVLSGALLLYTAGIFWALRVWGRAIHHSFVGALSTGLGFVALGPPLLASLSALGLSKASMPVAIAGAASLALVTVVPALIRHGRGMLTDELLRGERYAWFLGGTIAALLVQFMLWPHVQMKLPVLWAAYGPMLVLAAWLILFCEGRAGRQRGSQSNESFLGYGIIFLAVMLSMKSPLFRSLTLAAAALVWFDQSRWHRHAAHRWIASSLALAAGLSLALLPALPVYLKPLWASLVAAVVLLIGGRLWHKRHDWAQALVGSSQSALVFGLLASCAAQWAGVVPVWSCALAILLAAAALLIQACVSHTWRDVLLAAAVATLSLPYLGCVDMAGKQFYGNHMVWGLSCLALLWTGLAQLPGMGILRQTRSLTGMIWGILAIIMLLLRVSVESGRPAEMSALHLFFDYAGTFGVSVVLALVAWWSRSLLPGALCALLWVILFPELKAQLSQHFSAVQWGSGLGAASTSLVLIALTFWLSVRPALQKLGLGDLLARKRPFPFLRHDHTLITWPLLGAAMFLSVRASLWIPTQKLLSLGQLPGATVAASMCAALTWWGILAYRGPWGRSARGRTRPVTSRWWRRLVLLMVLLSMGSAAITMAIFSSAIDERPLSVLSWPLGLWVLAIVALKLPGAWALWERRAAAARLFQLTVRLAVPAGVLALIVVLAGLSNAQTVLLVSLCAGLAVWDCARSCRLRAGIWALVLAWPWLLSWADHGMGQAEAWLWTIDTGIWQRLAPLLALSSLPVFWREWRYRRSGYDLLPALFNPLLVSTLIGLSVAVVHLMVLLVQGGLGPDLVSWFYLLLLAGIVAWSQGSWFLLSALLGIAWLLAYQQFYQDSARSLLLEAVLAPSSWLIFASTQAFVLLALLNLPSAILRRVQAKQQPALFPSLSAHVLAWIGFAAAGLALFATWAWQPYRTSGLDIAVLWALLIPSILLLFSSLPLAQIASCFRVQDSEALHLRDKGFAALARLVGPLLLVQLCTAMIWTVRFVFGDFLLSWQIPFGHQCAIGMGLSILIAAGFGKLLRPDLQQWLRRAHIILAAGVLFLLAGSNFAHPDLALITWQRLFSAALLALIAGRAARHLAAGELQEMSRYRLFGVGIYHTSLALAIASAALIIPALRQPSTAMVALALSVLWLYLRSEQGNRQRAADYRNSTVVLSGLLLFLIVFRQAFTMAFFPESAGQGAYAHYHHNSPIMFLLGLVLLRSVALGADRLWAFVGGLACICASFFLLTWLPHLSPFEHPVSAAWSAVALAQLWTLITTQGSPLQQALRRLLDCDEQDWHALRLVWGRMILLLSYLVVFLAFRHMLLSRVQELPWLVLALATVAFHHGLLRQSMWRLRLALGTVLVGVQLGWVQPAALSIQAGAWAVLVCWAGLLAWAPLCRRFHWQLGAEMNLLRDAPSVLALLLSAVLGLLAVHAEPVRALIFSLLLSVLIVCGPLGQAYRRMAWMALFLAVLVLVQCMRVFGIDLLQSDGLAWMGLLWLGFAYLAAYIPGVARDDASPRALAWRLWQNLRLEGKALAPWMAFVALALQLLASGQLIYAQQAPALALLVALLFLAVALGAFWYGDAQAKRRMSSLFFAQLSVALGLLALRQLLRFRIPAYDPSWDVWGALLLSLLLAGAKVLLPERDKHVHFPLAWTAASMPLATLSWIFFNGLDSNLAIIALCLHSVSFLYIGGRRRRSPFHILATLGFVALSLLIVYENLGLTSFQAYTLPLGAGMLVLVQLLRDVLPQATRNSIIGVTQTLMIGSCVWYAVQQSGHVLITNAVLLGTGIVFLVASSFLHLRLYFFSAWGAIGIALVSFSYHVLNDMERGMRMSLIGGLILLGGAALVAGTVFLKAHRERIFAWIEAWKERYPE